MIEWNEEDFLNKYRGSETFITQEREYYELFLRLLNNGELLANIKFANDTLGVPPLKSFISYERDFMQKDVFGKKMSRAAKRGMGACFGYLYKFVYGGYESEQSWFNDQKTGIKTASFFKKR